MIAVRRVYKMRSSQRFVGIIFLITGLLLGAALLGAALSGLRDATFLEIMFPVVFVLGGGLFTARAFHNSVRLSEQVIELRSLRGSRILPFDKIKGRRRYLSRGGDDGPDVSHIVIESKDDRFPMLDIEEVYGFDGRFYAWFTSLPDPDELDKYRPKVSNFGLV